MGEAWIIDAVRTPRGKGKKDDRGARAASHPAGAAGAMSERALAARNGFDPSDVEDVVAGCVSQVGDQGACIARNAVLAARWPQDRDRRHAEPLLRLGPAGRELRRDGRDGGPAGPRHRRRRRVDVARCRWAPTAAGSTATTRDLRRAASDGAAGHLGGSDRHARGLQRARTSTPSRPRASAPPQRPARERFAKSARSGARRGARWCSTATSIPRADTTVESLAKLKPSFEGLGAYRPRRARRVR